MEVGLGELTTMIKIDDEHDEDDLDGRTHLEMPRAAEATGLACGSSADAAGMLRERRWA
jgi:hypothetical protein